MTKTSSLELMELRLRPSDDQNTYIFRAPHLPPPVQILLANLVHSLIVAQAAAAAPGSECTSLEIQAEARSLINRLTANEKPMWLKNDIEYTDTHVHESVEVCHAVFAFTEARVCLARCFSMYMHEGI